jgi:hypothetical protein
MGWDLDPLLKFHNHVRKPLDSAETVDLALIWNLNTNKGRQSTIWQPCLFCNLTL